jgi:hypothetical protein
MLGSIRRPVELPSEPSFGFAERAAFESTERDAAQPPNIAMERTARNLRMARRGSSRTLCGTAGEHMAYLVNVGTAGRIRESVSGHGARGYHIYRRRAVVFCVWAGIDVVSRRYYWRRRPNVTRYSFRSVQQAEVFRRKRLRELQGRTESYIRLPAGVRIRAVGAA